MKKVKKIIILFLIFSLKVFAIVVVPTVGTITICKSTQVLNYASPLDAFKNNGNYFNSQCAKGKSFYLYSVKGKTYLFSSNSCLNSANYNISCLTKNIIAKFISYVYLYPGGGYCESDYYSPGNYMAIDDNRLEFCMNKEGYFYNSNLDAWIPTDNSKNPICPDGKQWNKNEGKCIGLDDCPKGTFLYKGECITPDNYIKQLFPDKYNWVKTHCFSKYQSLSFTVGNDENSYSQCNVIYKCDNGKEAVFQVSCGKSSNGKTTNNKTEKKSSNSNNEVNNSEKCYDDEVLVIEGNNVYCEKINNVFKDNKNNSITNEEQCNTSGGSWLCVDGKCKCIFNNIDNHHSNVNNNKNNPITNEEQCNTSGGSWLCVDGKCECIFNDNKDICPNPCIIKNQVGTQTSLISINNYVCHIITYPKFKGCSLEYHIENGKCIPNCGGNNKSTDSNNSVKIDLNETNEKLSDINNILNDILNAKPDGNFTPNGKLSSDFTSFVSDYTKFFKNISSDFDSLKSSYENVKNMLKEDNYKLTILKSGVYSCPLNFTLYKKEQSLDICAFIAPYRPLLQLFFTFFFSINVVFFFIKKILNRSEK